MRVLVLVALMGVAACGGATSQLADEGGGAAAPITTASSPESWPPITDEEIRSGCLSFTLAVAEEHSNEVYDGATGVLQVYVGQQRFLLSAAVQECRDNSVAMERLKFADAEEPNRS